MPSWKKVIVSGSNAALNSLNVTTSLTASGLIYPTTDGQFSGQVLQTDAAGTLSFGNVNAVFETIYNGEATTITKGTPLYVSGSQGATPRVYRADTSDPNKMPVTFVAMENIGTASTGRGITLGLITGIDLTGYPVGTQLWVDGLGVLTSVRPTGSNDIIQPIGIVTKTGNGGQLNVLNPGPVLMPNMQTGYTFIGNGNNQPILVTTSSLLVTSASFANNASSSLFAVSSSQANSASFAINASSSLWAVSSSQANSASFAINASSSLFAVSSSRAVSSSFATLAASATSASLATNSLTSSNLTPAITNNTDNYILTANGNGTINGESLLQFDGQKLSVLYQSGDEGGEILLGKAATNTSLTGSGVTIDVWQNRLRFFEQGGTARGYYLDITSGGAGVGTNLASGGGTVTQVNTAGTVNGITLTGGPITGAGTITLGGTLSNILTSSLAQSGSTIGSTFVGLGSTVTTLAGLTSVTATNFTGTASIAANSAQLGGLGATSFVLNSQTSSMTVLSASFAINASSSLFAVSSSRAVSSSFATLAASANTVAVTDNTSTNATYYIPFVDSTSGNKALNVDSSTLTWNPSTNTLVAGNITGTATSATSASMASLVAVTDTTSGTGPYYLMFADGTSGNRTPRVDSSTLQFNATTNTLTVTNLTGTSSFATLAATATTATTATNANTASNITPAITNAADNRVLTANGGGTINGEANLTFNGTILALTGSFKQGHQDNIATGVSSHAQGDNTLALGNYSHAEGETTTAFGYASHAEGISTLASGSYTHAEGFSTISKGQYSHTEGYNTITTGSYSHAEGNGNITVGSYSHAEGAATITVGDSSHAEGDHTYTSGYASHAEGYFTSASGDYSHAEGVSTIASGDYSHAEGDATNAIGMGSHAEGTSTYAVGDLSHAEGEATYAGGVASHAEGYYTSASGNYQTVVGSANQPSTNPFAFIIGNGPSNVSSRSNLLYASGSNVQISGSLFVSRSDNPLKQAIYTTPGTKSEPAYTFIDDDDTGMFRNAANTVGLSGGGNIRLLASDTELRLAPGTTAAQANILMASNDTIPLVSYTPVASVSVGTATSASFAINASSSLFAVSSSRAVSSSFATLAATATSATTANSTVAAVTFNNSGAGDASGTSFNGSTARTISYNTVGAPSTGGTNATGTWGIGISGNAATATTASHALNADNIRIQTQDTTPVTFNITFAGASSGIQSLNVDPTTLTYSPSTSTFTTPIVNSTTAVQGGNGSASTPAFSFSGDTNTGMYNFGADSLGFSTGGTARMIISSSGNVGIVTTTPVRELQVGAFSGNPEICIGSSTTGTGALVFGDGATGNDPWRGYVQYNHSSDALIFGTTNAERARITAGGAMGLGVTPTNTAGRFEASNDIVAYSTSDKRWKNNIVKIDSPLEKISQISGVEFDWIEDEPFHGNKGHDVGVIAQEIELVIPEAVQTRESGMKAVQYDKIIPLLIESIKEQQKQIDELKKLVNKLTK